MSSIWGTIFNTTVTVGYIFRERLRKACKRMLKALGCAQDSEESEEENLIGTWGCQHGTKGKHETGDKSIRYTRRCRGSAFTCTDEIDPYFPTLAETCKKNSFERVPNSQIQSIWEEPLQNV